MSEFGEELLTRISEDFNDLLKNDRKLKTLANRVRDGTYKNAGDYAIRIGELLSKALNQQTNGLAYISNEVALEILTPLLEYDYDLVSEAVKIVQTNMNTESGLGIEALTADIDTNRIQGLADKVSSYKTLEEGRWVLNEPIINYSQAIVDYSIEKNARMAAKMGIKRFIVRKAEPFERKARRNKSKTGKTYYYTIPCEWCKGLAGTYEYKGNGANVPKDVFRRHESCRCIVDYLNYGGENQDVWSKAKWTGDDAEARAQAIKEKTKERAQKAEKEKADREARKQEKAKQIEEIRAALGFSERDAAVWLSMHKNDIAVQGLPSVLAWEYENRDFKKWHYK